jgi:hypothetical protein
LSHLVEGAKSSLKYNLIGAYLQGSFAVGDHSGYSDCDFIIVVNHDLAFRELQALQQLHKEIHLLPYPYWRRGLEPDSNRISTQIKVHSLSDRLTSNALGQQTIGGEAVTRRYS